MEFIIFFRDGSQNKKLTNASQQSFGIRGDIFNGKTGEHETLLIPWDSIKFAQELKKDDVPTDK